MMFHAVKILIPERNRYIKTGKRIRKIDVSACIILLFSDLNVSIQNSKSSCGWKIPDIAKTARKMYFYRLHITFNSAYS